MAFLVQNAFNGTELVADANNWPQVNARHFHKPLARAHPLIEPCGCAKKKTLRVTTHASQIRLFTSKKDKTSTAQREQPVVEEPWAVSSNISISQNNKGVGAGAGDDNW
jgi:hypothetical protein